MALSKKEKQKMGDAMMVAGTVRAASETYKAVKPIVKKVVKKVKERRAKRKKEGKWYVGKNIEKSIKKRKAKKQIIKQHNNTYEEGR